MGNYSGSFSKTNPLARTGKGIWVDRERDFPFREKNRILPPIYVELWDGVLLF